MADVKSKKEIMKEVAKLIRNILTFNGYDGNGRVRLYQELSVECLCYGKKDMINLVVTELKKYPNFEINENEYSWIDGKYKIYLTIM